MPINSRQKGAQGERELALEFSKLGFHAKRSQQHCGINSDSDVEVDLSQTCGRICSVEAGVEAPTIVGDHRSRGIGGQQES